MNAYCIFAFIFLNPLQQLDIKYVSIDMQFYVGAVQIL